MSRSTKILTIMMLCLAFQFTFLPTANAYLDPGSGSFIFQALVGVVLAVGLAVKIFWGKIVALVTRRQRSSDDA